MNICDIMGRGEKTGRHGNHPLQVVGAGFHPCPILCDALFIKYAANLKCKEEFK